MVRMMKTYKIRKSLLHNDQLVGSIVKLLDTPDSSWIGAYYWGDMEILESSNKEYAQDNTKLHDKVQLEKVA